MRTCVLAAAAALLVAGALTGCERAVPGTAAMTTEPGGATTSTSRPTVPRTTSPRTTTPRTTTPRTTTPGTPGTLPPGDTEDITCEEYLALDPSDQTAVISEILSGETSVLGPGNTEIAKSLADAVCSFLPESTVSEILTGGGPP